jgi:4-aminobutyrate aminotransferase-like enzyme
MTSKYSLFKKGFGPFASEIYHIRFPNVQQRPPLTDPEHGEIADVRGLGPMLAMELLTDNRLTPNPDLTLAFTQTTLARGLITIRAGLYSNCVRFLSPLNITDEQIDEALAVLGDVTAEATRA